MALDTNMTILVVEDSGTMRAMMKKFLAQAGFNDCILAVDGQDGVEKLQENIVDLVISDWNMPRMDGLELLVWMRESPSHENIPFIMASAQGDKSQREIAEQAGSSGHITKPFTPDEIKKVITEVFEGRGVVNGQANREFVDGKVKLRAVHIQITDHLTLGILKHQIATGEVTPQHFVLETQCLPGWNPVQEHIETGMADVAFVLAPLAMDLFAFDTPIRMVSLAHVNGTGFIHNSNFHTIGYDSPKDFYKWKVINIPHKMSVHHMLAHKYLNQLGLKAGLPEKGRPVNVRFEVVPPIQMPAIMKEKEHVGGFIVAEPIASLAVSKSIGGRQFNSGAPDIWEDHPCCIVAMRKEFIDEFPEAAEEFTRLIINAGHFIEEHTGQSAEIGVSFLDPMKKLELNADIVKGVLTQSHGIRFNKLYPDIDKLNALQEYMYYQMNAGRLIALEEFIDFRFIDEVLKKKH